MVSARFASVSQASSEGGVVEPEEWKSPSPSRHRNSMYFQVLNPHQQFNSIEADGGTRAALGLGLCSWLSFIRQIFTVFQAAFPY